jgi:hypothetical protein
MVDRNAVSASLIKQPSAWLPMAMSLAGLGLVLLHYALFGIVHEQDEGTYAHLFQMLMVAQVPLVALFALVWLQRMPRQALYVLGLQGLAALAAFTSVYFLT